HIYYYRRLMNNSEWTAWEKVPVDIQGDHLIPVVWNRRLYLFWPIFTQKASPSTGGTNATRDIVLLEVDAQGNTRRRKTGGSNGGDPDGKGVNGDGSNGSGGGTQTGEPQGKTPITKESLQDLLNNQAQPPQRYWEIGLAWSEYKQNKWTPKQVS